MTSSAPKDTVDAGKLSYSNVNRREKLTVRRKSIPFSALHPTKMKGFSLLWHEWELILDCGICVKQLSFRIS